MLKKSLNKLFALILILFLTIGIAAPYNVKAVDGSLSVTVSTSDIAVSTLDIIVGNTFNVSVTLSYPAGINTAQFQLVYDSAICSYVSGDADGSSYSGVIPITYMPLDYPTSATWNFTFRADQVGTCNFSTNGVVFIDTYVNTFSPSLGSASVKVMAQGSDDATLSNIQIAGQSITPAFAKWTLDYTCYVSHDVTSVDISAVASQGGRTVINGDPYNLAYGNNAISITSYAPNGKSMTYNINIVRAEAPTAPPETEPETETETETEPVVTSDVVITVDGNKYTLNPEFPEDEMPKGYVSEKIEIDGEEIVSAVSSVTGLTLVYFNDEDGEGRIFIYDKDSGSFEKYIVFTSGDNRYIYLDPKYADSTVDDASEGECEIQGETVNVLISDINSDFVYFYAVNQNGERQWYCYDIQEKTIQRKNISAGGSAAGGDIDKLQQELDSLRNTYDKVSGENDSLIKGRNITFIAGGVIIIALIVVIVVMAVHKSEKKHAMDIPVDDDNDYNEDDIIDEYGQEDFAPLSEAELQEAAAEEADDTMLQSGQMHETEGETTVETETSISGEETAASLETVESADEECAQIPETDAAGEYTVTEDSFDASQEINAQQSDAETEDDNDQSDVIVTKADMDAFALEAENLAKEMESGDDETDAKAEEEDEIEPEIIDLNADIFDDDDKADNSDKPESKAPSGGREPEQEKITDTDADGKKRDAEIELEPIELQPADKDDEEFFL